MNHIKRRGMAAERDRMLGLWDQTGAFADVGPLNDRGMRMALEEDEIDSEARGS